MELGWKTRVTPRLFWKRVMNFEPLELVISTDW